MTGPFDLSYRHPSPDPGPPATGLATGSVPIAVPPEAPQVGEGGALLTSLADGGLQIALGEDAAGETSAGRESGLAPDEDAATGEDPDPDLIAAAPTDPYRAGNPKFAAFFDEHYNPVARRAAELGVDPTLLLGIAAHESDWGKSNLANSSWNPFGATPDGYRPMTFGSNDAAWSYWAQQFGPRVRGVGEDASRFIGNLLMDNRGVAGATDQRGPYNSLKSPDGDEKWPEKAGNVIRSVRSRLPQWLACKAGSP